MKTVKTVSQQYCHEYRLRRDIHTSYGFGDTPEEARADAVYGSDDGNNHARDHSLGFGDWRVQEDSKGEHWINRISA